MQENSLTTVPPSAVTVTATAISGAVATTTPTTTNNSSDIDQAQFEADKRAVYKHPLFSLLALLLEKCEQATQGYLPSSNSSSASSPNGSTNGNSESDSFSRDVQAFVHLLEKEKRPLLTNDSELDGLMIKALQVLRIHLLELEKVQELCRDFCTRYIACLRGKMQSENLLRSDYALEHNNNLSNSNSPINSPEQDLSGPQTYYPNSDFLAANDGNEYIQGHENGSKDLSTVTNGTIANTNLQIPDMTVVPVPAPVPQHPPVIPTQAQILGSTPISQIGCPPLPLDQYSGQLSPCGSSDELDSEIDSNNDELGSNFSNNSGSKRQKRGILPKHATSVMRAWLFQHLVHPYPTEDEKRAIAAQTNLTLLQVNNWFINARRRILQPMLEHATDNNSGQSPPSKRYWPENLSTNQQPDANIENISANINRADSERLLAAASQKLSENFYNSSDESNDSLIIDQEN